MNYYNKFNILINKLSHKRDNLLIYKKNIPDSSHICAIFNGINDLNILSYGINNCRAPNSRIYGSIHAEISAIQKLPYRAKNKKIKKVDMLVIKSSKTHCISMSKPCVNCIFNLITKPTKLRYRINKIYYSNNKGEIICRTLSSLLNDDNHHITRAYKNI